MRKPTAPLLLALLALGVPRLVATDEKPAPSAKLSDLSWVAGHWRGEPGKNTTYESHYTAADGGLIVSASKEIRGGRAVSADFEMIFVKDGKVIYQPFPGGKKSEHAFPLIACDPAAKRAVFENKEHDYPQSFTFEQPAPDRLVITLSGPGKDGQKMDIVYDLKRVLAADNK